jgi:hypothetical protein
MPTYHCVSYCWGTLRDMQWITCDGQRLQITMNVDVMLRHLRKNTSPRNLWVDAICINQADDVEKGEQVRAMGGIYERADKVHVWLGPATVEAQIPSVFAILKNYALSTQKSLPVDLEALSSLVEPLNAFMARPWFTRRWVLQEVERATDVTVHCGDQRLAWTWFSKGRRNLLADRADRSSSFRAIGLISADITRTLDSLWSLGHRSDVGLTIFQLLWDYHTSVCADERDRLFALYGMLEHKQLKSIESEFDAYEQCPVDYSKHFTSVYTRIAVAGVQQGLGSEVLCHALSFGTLAQQHSDWPSWVPSWNLTRTTRKRFMSYNLMSIKNDSTIASNMLHLHGELFPIIAVLDTVSAGGVIAFLRHTKLPNHSSKDHFQTITAVINMLVDSFETCEDCYDCAGVQYESIITKRHADDDEDAIDGGYEVVVGWGDEIQDEWNNSYRFKVALQIEFGLLTNEDIESHFSYSPEALQQAFERITQQHRLFSYLVDKECVFGIAFASVEPGDFVHRPSDWGCIKSIDKSALVMRQHKPSPLQVHHDNNIFRLLGWCQPGWNPFKDTMAQRMRDVFIV